MTNLRNGRITWLLLVLVFATPMLLPLMGSDRSKPPKTTNDQTEPSEITNIVYRIIANEWQIRTKLQEYTPRVETYLQYYQPDPELGDVAKEDAYFLGRLKFTKQVNNKVRESSFIADSRSERLLRRPDMVRAHLRLDEFAVEPLVVDESNFDRKHYAFDPVRWEYLGDVRCLAIDIHPRDSRALGAFVGRIWVEDHNYAIVRLNGTRINPPKGDFYVHFDCWRENLQDGLWLPVYVYSQESDRGKRFRYKAETRFWGYDLTARHQQQEWTNILVDAPAPVRDNSEVASDMSPVESQRQWTMDAEHNVLDRLEKARLIAPPGPVDKVLETVVNNLIVTNHLENLPPVHCRVMLTSTLESFSLAYTIVLSRGLIDVLPDESSLAMILAHEVAHIALGQKVDSKFAFNDRLQNTDEELLASLDVARSREDEVEADAKGIEFLKNSPYKDKLGQVGLFLQEAINVAPHVSHLLGTHLGNGLTEGNAKMVRMEALTTGAPALTPRKIDQIAALPLGSRVQVNAWDGGVSFTTRKGAPLVDASEKMPFRVTPVIPYLRFYAAAPKTEATARN
ncbi:MAG: M48 family metalloprotease [Terriglobia bacterium]